MKKLFLILFSIAVSAGNIFAHETTFFLTRKGGKEFRYSISYMQGGLAQFFPKKKNDVGFTRLFLRYNTNNDKENERANATLNSLIDNLINEGFANCMDKYANEYIYVQPLKGTDYTDIGIDFKWAGITSIQLIETQD